MFAKKAAAGGVLTKELKRHLEHQTIQQARAQAAADAKATRIMVNVHAKSASNLIAVDNRQFSMTSDPYCVAKIVDALGRSKGDNQAQTRAIKRTLNPKWDEWLQLHSNPLDLTTAPVPPYVTASSTSSRKDDKHEDVAKANYVSLVLDTTETAEQELVEFAKKLKVRLDLYDFDALSDDDPLGHTTISIADIIENGEERRKGIYELVGDFDVQYTLGMNKKYKQASEMSGTLHLIIQLALPKLPPAFHVDIPALIARMRPKTVEKNYWNKIKYKPFHCKIKGCSRRFKKSETLMLHYQLHDKEEQARRHIEEEKQRLLENRVFEHQQNEQNLIRQQQQMHGEYSSNAFATRKVTAASTSTTWAQDCRKGRKDAVIKGLTQGFFLINVRDKHDRKSPLIVASRWGEEPLVKALLLRKADVTALDMHGNSSLGYACQYGHIGIVKQLLAVKNGGKEMLAVGNKMLFLPLHRAAMYNHTGVIELLLKQGGAGSRTLDAANRTPLEWARLYKHTESIALLEEWEVLLSKVVKGH